MSRSTQEVKAGYLSHPSLISGNLVPPIQDEECSHALKPPVLDSSFRLESPGHGKDKAIPNPRSVLHHMFEVLRPLNSQDLSEELYNTGKQLTCENKIKPERTKEKKVHGKRPKNREGRDEKEKNGCKLVGKTETDDHSLKINQDEHSSCPEKYDNSYDTFEPEDRDYLNNQEIFYTKQDSGSFNKDPDSINIKDSNSSIKDYNTKINDLNTNDAKSNIKDSKSNIKDSESTITQQNVLSDTLKEHITAKIQVLPSCVMI